MSEYYLADHKAEERSRQRRENEHRDPPKAQDIKVTLLGDFMFPAVEPQGCDPYNSIQGKATREAWRMRRDRR